MTPPPAGGLGAAGFAHRADVYERGRPGYPDALLALLGDVAGLGPGCRVVDLAAGTGKLSRELRRAAGACLAVEPSAAMRTTCRRRAPGVAVVGGSAEAIPLATSSCDLVTVAQAFHWFDPRRSLAEIGRVLRPGGSVALVWNEREERTPWAVELGRLMQVGHEPHPDAVTYRPALDAAPGFGPAAHHTMPFAVEVARQGLVDMVASRSYVNVLGDEERAAVLDRVAALAATLPEPVTVPYRTEVLLARLDGGD